MNGTVCAPFIRNENNIVYNDLTRLVSLMPAIVAAVWFYGLRFLILLLFCPAVSLITDYAANIIAGRKLPVDLSSISDGIIFALLLPPDSTLFVAFTGIFAGEIIFRHLSGGRGSSFIAPALGSRLLIRIIFPLNENALAVPGENRLYLSSLLHGSGGSEGVDISGYHMSELVAGRFSSLSGVSCAALLAAGMVYLICKRVYKLYIPALYLLALMLFRMLWEVVAGGGGETLLFLITSGVLFIPSYLLSDDSHMRGFGPLAAAESLICAFFTFILSYRASGIDIIIIPVILTQMLDPVLSYSGHVLRLWREGSSRAQE